MRNIHIKNGFTMIELVMVVVVLGILAALAAPNMQRDLSQEAADTILSDIRYAQHMAINDYVENPGQVDWQKSFWQIKIESCASNSGLFITIGSDKNRGGDIDRSESAIDPANGKPMFWTNTAECSDGGDGTVSENIFLTKKFGVVNIETAGGCSQVQHIGFDHLGRPHVGLSDSTFNYDSYMSSECNMTFNMINGDPFTISILPETGYAYIVNQDAS
jgi:prepilin-type N-terminal cleavage/methylation domain-containing protein